MATTQRRTRRWLLNRLFWLQLLLAAALLHPVPVVTVTIQPSSTEDNQAVTTNTLNDTKVELHELLLLRQFGPIFGGPSAGVGGGAGGVGAGAIGGGGIGGGGGILKPGFGGAGGAGVGGGCPLCDSSVYSYCSYKMLHDSCCCDFMAAPHLKPPQCYYSDCTLLYAKTCYEHLLIKNCCCNRPYR